MRRTQSQRLLAALRRGPVTRLDFQGQTIDGGDPIINFPGRIHDLVNEGHLIEKRMVKASSGGSAMVAEYTLATDSARAGYPGRSVGAGFESPAPTPTSPGIGPSPVNADGLDSECRGVKAPAPSSPSAPSSPGAQEALFPVEPERPTYYAQEAA